MIATVRGPARGVLTAERVALNFLCHLSGVASATAGIVASVRPWKARITCTRKTMPGLRAVQKHAVRCGGGSNHRFGLDDAILIKDNHVAIAGGVRPAIERARRRRGPPGEDRGGGGRPGAARGRRWRSGSTPCCSTTCRPTCCERRSAWSAGRAVTEASGRVNPQTAPAIAAAGVDLISVGWLTHKRAGAGCRARSPDVTRRRRVRCSATAESIIAAVVQEGRALRL